MFSLIRISDVDVKGIMLLLCAIDGKCVSKTWRKSHRPTLHLVYIENDNVHILCLIWHRFQYYPTQLFSDIPKTPTIESSKHPFVGDQIELTCTSQVQRWPVGLSSSLAYTFSVDGAQQQHNTLNINVTDSDKGKHVYCTATDGLLRWYIYSGYHFKSIKEKTCCIWFAFFNILWKRTDWYQ
jgi:hypothetical protein